MENTVEVPKSIDIKEWEKHLRLEVDRLYPKYSLALKNIERDIVHGKAKHFATVMEQTFTATEMKFRGWKGGVNTLEIFNDKKRVLLVHYEKFIGFGEKEGATQKLEIERIHVSQYDWYIKFPEKKTVGIYPGNMGDHVLLI